MWSKVWFWTCFEMPIGHSSGAVKQAGGVEFGNWGEIWTGDIKSAVISILMTFKAIGAHVSPRERL